MGIAVYMGVMGVGLLIYALVFYPKGSTALGRFLVRRSIVRSQSKLGLLTSVVDLPSGGQAWFLERPNREPVKMPPLLILPGATLDMVAMGIVLGKLLKAMPNRRIIVVELPHHGRNVSVELDFSRHRGRSVF